MTLGGAIIALPMVLGGPAVRSQTLAAVPDEMLQPLGNRIGDAARGRAAVADREGAHCLLCHQAPIPEERFHGDLAPTLAGVGARLTPGQIRFRIVDASRLNPETIMPPYFRREGLTRVARSYRDRTVLSEQQVEDIVTYLSGLKE